MNEEGVDIPDVFRRPGNAAEQKKLIKKLTEGKPVKFEEYNFYTLASVIKVCRLKDVGVTRRKSLVSCKQLDFNFFKMGGQKVLVGYY